MRIIVVVPYPIETSGSVEFARPLCASLRAKSFDVTLACCQAIRRHDSENSTDRSSVSSFGRQDVFVQPFANEATLLDWVESQIFDCDIVFWVGIFQDPDFRARQINLSARARKECRTKTVFMWERTGHKSVVPERRLFLKLIKDASDSIAALNPAHLEMLVERGASRDRVALFSTGIDTRGSFLIPQPDQKAKLRKENGWSDDETLVLVLSRFVIRKRIDFVIRTWKKNEFLKANAKLVVMGSGFGAPDSNENLIMSLAKSESSIEVIPYEKGMKQQTYYNAADVFVSASELEGEPTSLLEAMASGLPVIASDIPGHRHIVNDGKNGFLFPLKDEFALTEAIKEMTGDSLIRRQFSDRARMDVVARRDIELIADRFLEIANAPATV